MSAPVGVILAEGLSEPRRIVTPLGIRFRDVALDLPIRDGLVVFVKATPLEEGPRSLAANPSGVFGLHSLPLLHDFEYPSDSGVPISSPSFPFVVMAADRLSRFLPVVFGIELPLSGTLSPPTLDLDPDPAPLLDAYLFSAPTRPVTNVFAAVRADVRDRDTDTPAAHALVRVTLANRTLLGTADDQGRVLVLLPYPLLEQLRLGSPPGSGQQPPYKQSWPVSLEVWYRPGLPAPFGAAAVLPPPWTTLPGLRGILESQGSALIWSTEAGPPVTTWTGYLTYEHELVVRTGTTSQLWISRGASPP
jgi:hypothetical protein